MKIFLTAIAVLVLLAAVAVAAAYAGLLDVAATEPDPPLVAWYLHTAREHAVARRAAAVTPPPLDDARLLGTGLAEYHEMCVACHGAPGVEPADLARGLNPMPPSLDDPGELHEASTARTFWIVKHGLRMTGMPAFGPTHDDEELWAITAFVDRLPELSAEDYAAMVRNAGLAPVGEEGADHHHGSAAAGGRAGAEGAGDAPAAGGAVHPHPAGTPEDHSHGSGRDG
jgi:mono/diheme cytochrome c family protein